MQRAPPRTRAGSAPHRSGSARGRRARRAIGRLGVARDDLDAQQAVVAAGRGRHGRVQAHDRAGGADVVGRRVDALEDSELDIIHEHRLDHAHLVRRVEGDPGLRLLQVWRAPHSKIVILAQWPRRAEAGRIHGQVDGDRRRGALELHDEIGRRRKGRRELEGDHLEHRLTRGEHRGRCRSCACKLALHRRRDDHLDAQHLERCGRQVAIVDANAAHVPTEVCLEANLEQRRRLDQPLRLQARLLPRGVEWRRCGGWRAACGRDATKHGCVESAASRVRRS